MPAFTSDALTADNTLSLPVTVNVIPCITCALNPVCILLSVISEAERLICFVAFCAILTVTVRLLSDTNLIPDGT